jgi:SAM-dependent methyltransferase
VFDSIDLSAYADATIDALVSGPGRPLENTIFLDRIQQAQGQVLEVGCGLGRYTIPLAECGIDITGVELSAPSLAYARQAAGDLPIRWVEADARDFQLETRFPIAFARGCVINFMLTRIDQEAMLARVREHLTPGGIFMFDTCYNRPPRMVDEPDEVAWFDLTHPNGRQIYITGTSRYEHTRQLWIQTCYERWDQPDGELVRPPWTLTLRYVAPLDMEALLHYNGFTVLKCYADWDGSPYTEEDEYGPAFVCQKRD